MEQEALPEKHVEARPANSFWSYEGLFLFILFPYAVLEYVFLLHLWPLIHSQIPFYFYLLNALAFEACLIASAIMLWRCLRVLKNAKEVTPDYKDLAWRMTVLVLMLLLALMQLSSFSRFYDKIKPW